MKPYNRIQITTIEGHSREVERNNVCRVSETAEGQTEVKLSIEPNGYEALQVRERFAEVVRKLREI